MSSVPDGPIIDLKGVGWSLGGESEEVKVILRSVNLTIYREEILAIVGRNAVGKSTLAKIIVDLLKRSFGEIKKMVKPNSLIFSSFAPQDVDDSLLPWRSNLDNISLPLEAVGYKKDLAREVTRDFVQAYGLPVPLEKFPLVSSGGERQMVVLTRAAVVEPQLLVMDEPFSRIDPDQVILWRSFLHLMIQKTGMSCLMISHNLDDVLAVADRVLVLQPTRRGAVDGPVFSVQSQRESRRDWLLSEDAYDLRVQLSEALHVKEAP